MVVFHVSEFRSSFKSICFCRDLGKLNLLLSVFCFNSLQKFMSVSFGFTLLQFVCLIVIVCAHILD